MSDLCGYEITDEDGMAAPCDRPVVGWRWYQECEHEPMLDRACYLHENDGGQRVAEIIADRNRARGVAVALEQRLAVAHEAIDELLGRLPEGCDGLGCGGWDDQLPTLRAALEVDQ